MMRKATDTKRTRISYGQAAEILRFAKSHILGRTLCDWVIDEEAPGFYRIHALVKPVAFVPVAAIETLAGIPMAIWDGGLRTLSLPTREVACHTFFGADRRRDGETYDEVLGRLGIALA